MNCVFCHKENITTDIVYQDTLAMAFMEALTIYGLLVALMLLSKL